MKKTDTDSRHTLSYFNLLDALDAGNCPICALTDKESKTHLRSLYYEFVNDAMVRDALHHSRGFCNGHAWTSTEIPCTDTGISIIYNDLLQAEISTMRQILTLLNTSDNTLRPLSKLQKKKALALAIDTWQKRKACLVCTSEARATIFYLRELIDHFHEETVTEKFQASPGLCLPHLKILVSKFRDHPNLPALLKIEIEKCHSLSWELGEFWRKHDYRFSHEPKGAESDSWYRVIQKFVGMREHFGNDVMQVLPEPPRESPYGRFRQAIQKHRKNVKDTSWRDKKSRVSNPMGQELTHALKRPGCPVCRLTKEAGETYLFWLLKQNYDNPSETDSIADAGGFCHEHARWLSAHGPDYANTILSEKLIARFRDNLETFTQSLRTSTGDHSDNQPLSASQRVMTGKGTCPACLVAQQAERSSLHMLAALLAGDDGQKNRALYLSSEGVCLRHFSQLVPVASHDVSLFLVQDMKQRLEKLSGNLREFLEKSDYRHQDESSEDHSSTWKKAFARLFGNFLDDRDLK